MIHEATYGDEYYDRAIENSHTTLSEAIELAEKAQVKTLVLTHFSQRYPRVPPIIEGNLTLIYASDLLLIDCNDVNKYSRLSKSIFSYFSN